MDERLVFRTTNAARAAAILVLGIAMGCGSSLKNDNDGDGGNGTETGGGAGEGGGSGGSSGSAGSSAEGGSAQGGSAEGGSAQGGSATGGSAQGGMGGAAGEGGDSTIPTRLFLQTANALFATDPETAETTEVCPPATTPVRYNLIDWVNERAIVFRQYTGTVFAGEILRVALDGSECTSFLLSESVYMALWPAAGDHIVLGINPALTSTLGAMGGGDAMVTRPAGLASLALDGSPLEVLAPDGVLWAQVVGERVLFVQSVEAGFEIFSALPGAGSVTPLVPIPGSKNLSAVRGRRVLVNDTTSSDPYAVDVDGGNLVPLATGADLDFGVGFVENRVIISRTINPGITEQRDLLSVDENGGELTPIAFSADSETFLGSVGERVIYQRADDLHTVRADGSDARPILETPGVFEVFAGAAGDRIVFGSVHSSGTRYFSAAPDGSDVVTLYEASSGFAGAAGDRVVLYIGAESYDLVSVPVTGGDPFLLADGAATDWLVGTLGTTLVIQRGDDREAEGEVFRIDADGSRGARLHASARYIGSVSEACGAVVAGRVNPPCSE